MNKTLHLDGKEYISCGFHRERWFIDDFFLFWRNQGDRYFMKIVNDFNG